MTEVKHKARSRQNSAEAALQSNHAVLDDCDPVLIKGKLLRRRTTNNKSEILGSMSSQPSVKTYRPKLTQQHHGPISAPPSAGHKSPPSRNLSPITTNAKVNMKGQDNISSLDKSPLSLGISGILNHQRQDGPKSAKVNGTSRLVEHSRPRKNSLTGSHSEYAPPMEPYKICNITTTMFFEEPEDETTGGKISPSPFSRRSSSGSLIETQEVFHLNMSTTTEDVIISVLERLYGKEWVQSRGKQEILCTFGLYEAEMVADDEDSDAVLSQDKTPILTPTTTLDSFGLFSSGKPLTPIAESDSHLEMAINGHFNSRKKSTTEFSHRIFNRVLKLDEIPLFVHHNWKFYSSRPIFRRKKSTSSDVSPLPTSYSPNGAVKGFQPRKLHFVIKKLNPFDLKLIGVEDMNISEASLSNTGDILRTQQYSHFSLDRLSKRMTSLAEDEERLLKEAFDRYRKQMRWIKLSYKNSQVQLH